MATAAPPPVLRNRIVGSAEVPPGDLVANPNNWRTHPKAQRDALAGALNEVGWVQQIVVNTTTGRMVDGHARAEEALRRGAPTVPVLYVELSDAEEALVLATLDPIGAMAGRDQAALNALLAEITIDDDGISALLADLALGPSKQWLTDPDEAPDLPAEPWVKAGEVFELGEHRIMCGDSTDASAFARASGGTLADLMVTDPPYGVAYQRLMGGDPDTGATKEEWREYRQARYGLAKRLHRRGDVENLSVANDDLGFEGTRDLIAGAIHDRLRPGGAFYVFAPPGDQELAFRLGLADAGIPMRHSLVWVKDRFAFGRADYHYRHESILYGWREGAGHFFVGDRTHDTVLEFPSPKRSTEHPTMKPVELVGHLIANSSRSGDRVFDPFLGSGTTLIAAEQLGRRAIGIELEPRYVQVAIERWQAFTGRKAERVDG